MLQEDLAYMLLWHRRSHLLRGDHFPHLSNMFDTIIGENQAPDKSWGEWIQVVWRHQRCLSHRFLISVSQRNRLANRAELCNSMQLRAAAHKSLRALILSRLKLKTHPESSGSGFSFVGICFSFKKKILRSQVSTCVFGCDVDRPLCVCFCPISVFFHFKLQL